VEPRVQRPHQQRQPARIAAGVVLAQRKLDGIDRRADHVRVETVLGQRLQRRQDERLHTVGIGHSHALQSGRESHLPRVVGQAAEHVFAQPGVDQRLAQR